MSDYWDTRFLRHYGKSDIKTIVEVGSRTGEEAIMMSRHFPNAQIYTCECNPNTIEKCKENLKPYKNIIFCNQALGNKVEHKPFYSYIDDNNTGACGASSFLFRIDGDSTMVQTGILKINTLNNFIKKHKIKNIDLLLLDTQGSELDIIKGLEEHINNVKYIIAEIPKQIPNWHYLPKGLHSKYIHAPAYEEIVEYLAQNNFEIVEKIHENMLEDNILFSNIKLNGR
jgi:FkbM family methyltransferase